MKKLLGIRFLVTLLCLILTVSVFVACDNGNGGDETSGNGETSGGAGGTETVTVANYTLLTSATADENVNEAAMILIDAVKQYTGADIVFKTDSEAASDYEILIGSTNRAESESVLSELNGQNGYVVKKVGNKIVINATSTAMLDDAANYFVNNYVSSGADGAFPVASDLCYTYGATGGFSLLDADNNCQYTLIYSQDVDTETNTRTSNGKVIDYYNKGLDYVYQYILDVWNDLSGEIETTIPIDIDYGAAKDENLEILVGRTNRPETATFLSTCAPNEYGYGVVGNKLVIAGWSDLTIGMAAELFLADCEQYIVENDGVKNLVLSEGDSVTAVYDTWNVDVPLHTGGELNGVVELINNAYELYYVNSSADAFREYRTQIEAAGYELWQENQIGNNLYATYYSSKMMLHTYYLEYSNAVRVIVESRKTAVLPQNEDPNMGAKITDTSFTMFDSDQGASQAANWGNCFIITLEDGSFILHDGAANYKHNNQKYEREELYNLLKTLNKREDGEIVIAAWIISHQHFDHFMNAYDVFEYYKKDIKLERIIYNVAENTVRWNSNNPNTYYEDGKIDNVATWYGAEQVIMHTGQTIQIRNLKLEVLYTVEDIYPEHVITFNNTGLTHRFKVGEGENEQIMTILGDIELKAAEIMVDMYGDALKCDIMQVAHHGSGGSIALYKAFSPTIVVWPNSQSAVNKALSDPNSSNQWYIIDQSLMNQKNVKLLVVADNGHKTIMLPLLGITNNTDANEDLVIVTPREDGRP